MSKKTRAQKLAEKEQRRKVLLEAVVGADDRGEGGVSGGPRGSGLSAAGAGTARRGEPSPPPTALSSTDRDN